MWFSTTQYNPDLIWGWCNLTDHYNQILCPTLLTVNVSQCGLAAWTCSSIKLNIKHTMPPSSPSPPNNDITEENCLTTVFLQRFHLTPILWHSFTYWTLMSNIAFSLKCLNNVSQKYTYRLINNTVVVCTNATLPKKNVEYCHFQNIFLE